MDIVTASIAQSEYDNLTAYRNKILFRKAWYASNKRAFETDLINRISNFIENKSNRSIVQKEFSFVNYVRQVVDKLAGNYSNGVTRSIDGEEVVYRCNGSIDDHLFKMDAMSILCGTSFLWLQYDTPEKFYIETITPDRMFVESDVYQPNNVQKAHWIMIETILDSTSNISGPDKIIYDHYERYDDGKVHLKRINSKGILLNEQPEPAIFDDYPFVKLDYDSTSLDFFPQPLDDLIDQPVRLMILQTLLAVGFKFNANPLLVTSLDVNSLLAGMAIGPGTVISSAIDSTAEAGKIEYVSPSTDYQKLNQFLLEQLYQWLLTHSVPTDDFKTSNTISTGIALMLSRKPLQDVLFQRRKALVAVENELYRIVSSVFNLQNYVQNKPLTVRFMNFSSTITEEERLAALEKKIIIAEKLASLKGITIDEAIVEVNLLIEN